HPQRLREALPRRVPETKKTAGFPPPFRYLFLSSRSAQQLKHALLRGGRQRLAVGRFLVGVGQRQVGRTGLQHVDQVLREVLTDLHDRQVRTQGRRFGAERGAGRAEQRKRLVRRGVIQEVGPANVVRETEAR